MRQRDREVLAAPFDRVDLPVAVVPTDAVEDETGPQVVLGDGDDVGDRRFDRLPEGLAVEHDLGDGQRHLELDHVIGPQEQVLGPVAHLVEAQSPLHAPRDRALDR